MRAMAACGLALGVAVTSPGARAATLPSGFSETPLASSLPKVTAMAFAPDGRLFVAQQTGELRVIKNDALLPAPFVSLTVDSTGERGLLGIAFDPGFLLNGLVYVYYTATTPVIHNRVSRFRASGDVAAPGSELVIVDLDPLSATNHNGGAIHFGPDGRLYVAVGDNANTFNAQSLTNRHGKLLRLAADGAIPTDNPFFATASGANRAIWALGLRNPYTFAFEPGTGRMFINDVGQGTWEEIDDGVAGANYGWSVTEGPTSNPAFRSPLLAYNHSEAGVCAISGGAFHSADSGTYPADYAGDYFYADFCAGWIRRFDPVANTVTSFASAVLQPVDLTTGPDGNLYYLARDNGVGGSVVRVGYCAGSAPTLSAIQPVAGPSGSFALGEGSGFAPGARLEFGVMPGESQAMSGGLLATVPPLPPGPVSVRGVNPNGCRSNAVAFSVTPAVACGLLGVEPLLAVPALGLLRRLRGRRGARSAA